MEVDTNKNQAKLIQKEWNLKLQMAEYEKLKLSRENEKLQNGMSLTLL